MKFIPMLYSTPMVQGILENRKKQTRRTRGLAKINEDPERYVFWGQKENGKRTVDDLYTLEDFEIEQPYGVIGDVLWVRETFAEYDLSKVSDEEGKFVYKANNFDPKIIEHYKNEKLISEWKPSIFMPKEACRLFLEVTNVRVEQLQEINEKDAIAEGVFYDKTFKSYNCYLCDKKGHFGGNEICEDGFFDNAFESFRSLWKSINGEDSWSQNPWVWVYEFKRVEKPENFLN